jgi:transposase
MILLAADTKRDQEMIDKFQRAYENLKKIVDKQNEKIKDLENELNEYKKRHPSNIGVKNGKTYDIAVSGDVQPESMIPEPMDRRKQGAQPGHTGHFRIRKRPTEKSTIHLDLHECPECHSSLRRKGSRKRIIEDIPIIKTKIIEYRMDRLYCSKCHRIYEPKMPDALPNATLSLRAMLTVAYFRIGMRMSIENVSATMMNVFGIRISEGGIQNILSQLSDSLGREYSSLLQAIRDAPSRHMDSTSWRIDGNPYNLWTFLTRSEAIFHISKGNGHEVPLELLKDHEGTDIHDRYSAFETFASITNNDQQYCWSHIICDAKELEDFYGFEGTRIKRSLQTVFEEAKEYHGHGTMDDIERLHHKLVFLLDSYYEHRRSRRFVDNLLKRKKEWLFNFVMNPDVEPTNNRAERALRPSVIYRKVSGGSRSEKGAEIYTRIYSIYYTSKLRGKNFIEDTPSIIKRSSNPG